jgi:F-type H+-transporting ATPase subunit b
MVSLNLTIVVELALFLIFYGVSRRFIFAPLHRLTIERQARIRREQDLAQKDQIEADRLQQLQADRLVATQQQGAQRLREARFNAYRQNRIEADERRQNADTEVAAFHVHIQAHIEHERERYAQVLPDLVEAMDRQVNVEGSLM